MRKGYIWILVLAGCFPVLRGAGQLVATGSGYFQNPYLFNPALAGQTAKTARIGVGYLRQNSGVDNSPVAENGAADYGFNDRVGAGLQVFTDKAGLLSTTRVMGTYSYHIRWGSDEQAVHFGLSAGGEQRHLNFDDVNGNLADPTLYNYNDRKMQFQADAGAAYTDKHLELQASFPNLVSFVRRNQPNEGYLAGSTTFFVSAAYTWFPGGDEDGVSVEPKVAYRGQAGAVNIFDAGANVVLLQRVLNVFGMYHTAGNATLGAGVTVAKLVQVTAMYTTQSSALHAYSSGDFELGLLFKIH
jgi:type IX secretion system PorP/SprF family membrane protein